MLSSMWVAVWPTAVETPVCRWFCPHWGHSWAAPAARLVPSTRPHRTIALRLIVTLLPDPWGKVEIRSDEAVRRGFPVGAGALRIERTRAKNRCQRRGVYR